MAFNQPQEWSPEPYEEINIDYYYSTMIWPYPVFSPTYPPVPREESLALFNQKYAHKALDASNRLTIDELELVRRHLSDLYHESAAFQLRFQLPYSHGWSWSRMMPEPAWFSTRTHALGLWNKQTAVYFIGDSEKSRQSDYGYSDRRLGAYMYREWHRVHDGRPNMQRHNFFASALKVKTTTKKSSDDSFDVAAVIAIHRRLCNLMSAKLYKKVIFHHCGVPRAEDGANFPQAGIAKTWREHGFTMGHLFRAVLIVADENVIPETCPVQPEQVGLGDHTTLEEYAAYLERLMPECRVLMIRTGDDAHLSRPVSFASLVDSNRGDDGSGQVDMVRVSVPVAIRFLHELQVREEAAYPDLRRVAERMTEEREHACREWMDSVMRHAEDVGMDGNYYTWKAVRRMWAARDGETFSPGQGDETRLFPLYSWTSIW